MKQPIGSQDKCIMDMVVEGFGMCDSDLMRFNRPHKHQQATFLIYITTANGDKITKLQATDVGLARNTRGIAGKNRPTTTFDVKHPKKEDWALWRRELSKTHTRWVYPLAHVWRCYYDGNKDKIQAKLEGGTEVYIRIDG